MARRAPNSRPVHPCYLSIWEGSGGCDFSTWAKIDVETDNDVPNLVTAQGSTLTIYSIDQASGKLVFFESFPNLYGNVCFIETLKNPNPDHSDSLLLGFSGLPRLAVVSVKASSEKLLLGTTLLDLTLPLQELSYGSVAPLEQDLLATVLQNPSSTATVAVTLGGGVSMACLQLKYTQAAGWQSINDEPYVLPLQSLSAATLDESVSPNVPGTVNRDLNQSIVTGFGDILSTAFLPGYLEPTMAVLHSNPLSGGRAWPGRLGRESGGTRHGMILSSIALTVSHSRSAILWSTQVPADALEVYPTSNGCLVHCANSMLDVTNTGQIQQCLAVNGWVKASVPSEITVTPNPWPFPKLAIALDGAKISFVTDKAAFCVLRYGQVYLLQYTDSWSLLPLYMNIGALGQIENLTCWPLGKVISSKILEARLSGVDKSKLSVMDTGLLFAGSRLGDSSLLGFALETTSVADALEGDSIVHPKLESYSIPKEPGEGVSSEYDMILDAEEEALYAAPTMTDDNPTLIPATEDEYTDSLSIQERKRTRLSRLILARSLSVLDSLTALGPLGSGCAGPLAEAISPTTEEEIVLEDKTPSVGATGYIFPCGYGSSGGLALLTTPGRDDRSIVAEEDCVNASAMFSLPRHRLVVLCMEVGMRFLRLEKLSEANTTLKVDEAEQIQQDSGALKEIDLDQWCTAEALQSLNIDNAVLLTAGEISSQDFYVVLGIPNENASMAYNCLLLSEGSGQLKVKFNFDMPIPNDEVVSSLTPFCNDTTGGEVLLACTLCSGGSKLFKFSNEGSFETRGFDAELEMEIDNESEEHEVQEAAFYSRGNIVSMDVFQAPKGVFAHHKLDPTDEEPKLTDSSAIIENDDDDEGLYGNPNDENGKQSRKPAKKGDFIPEEEVVSLVAICRQSGKLEIYSVSDVFSDKGALPLFVAFGASHGVSELQDTKAPKLPRSHTVFASEIRFFFCGPSSSKTKGMIDASRIFCLAIETNDGDTLLYQAELSRRTKTVHSFARVPTKHITRPSREQGKHLTKLRRHRMVSQRDEAEQKFRYNRLFAFQNLTGQDGLFAAVARPAWFVAERGRPMMLCHRSRHAAPAGASPRPVTGFCSSLLQTAPGMDWGFMTLHERVGRVGSQRITVFDSLLDLSSSHGLIPGGGIFVQKVPLGVTVRRIQLIEGTGPKPLYAVLISRENESDLSNLNTDGLSPEERQRIAEEKENATIKRQVEADLGGFDMEQEWVEEIEREDCFQVDSKLGGAPPIPSSTHSLWIVDPSAGWVVVDSYELEEHEHSMTMQVLNLSEFTEVPGAVNDSSISEEDLEKRPFIAVGTAIVDKDGEDVSGKGRVLLFELKQSSSRSSNSQSELNLVYEKTIFHGPVISLSCLVSEGKSRLVIAAGADINVEQWGAEKLTQVGFFRATMSILDTKLFKNFMVLSDAYDSLYFLIWRESDMSLTLLAKDYDPIPVYASGLLSRGGSLDIVCHDDRENLQFFQYAPGDAAARGGNRLVCRADFHLGSQTTDLQSYFCRSSLLVNTSTPSSSLSALKQQDKLYGKSDDDQRLGVHFGTSDGGYGAVVPLSEPIYWRLTALQSVMVNALESDCSLSQRAWRLYRRTPRRGGCRQNERKKGVIDGDLVTRYIDLPISYQEEIASAIGSTVDLILDNLLELACSTMVV